MPRLPGVLLSLAALSLCTAGTAFANSPTTQAPNFSASIQINEEEWPTDCVASTRADRKCTPSDVMIDSETGEPVTAEKTCVNGYSRGVRDVSQEKKADVYRHYGIKHRRPGEYDIDHLIPLKLGGSNDYLNLWPEPNPARGDARAKQIEEVELTRQVCQHGMALTDAQEEMRNNWSAEYEHSNLDSFAAKRGGFVPPQLRYVHA